MPIYHPQLEQRFKTFPPEQQLLMIANELNRAAKLTSSPAETRNTLYRALELLDFARSSSNELTRRREIHVARNTLAAITVQKEITPRHILHYMNALISLSSKAHNLLIK